MTAVAAFAMLALGAESAKADGLPWEAVSLRRPNLGCHRVYFTPPGWTAPVEIEVCP